MIIDGIDYKEPNIGKWDKWTIFQYRSNGHIEGISGLVDCDVFLGTVDELKKYGKPMQITETAQIDSQPIMQPDGTITTPEPTQNTPNLPIVQTNLWQDEVLYLKKLIYKFLSLFKI